MRELVQHFKYSVFAIVGSVILSVFTLSAIAFTEPTALPPDNNVPPPITISGVMQTKAGSLTVGGILSTDTSVSSPEFCLAGDCISVWPVSTPVTQVWTVIDANSIYYPGSRVGIGTNIPAAPLHILSQNDNLLQLNRNGAIYRTTLRIGTDNALVVESGGLDTLTLRAGTVTAAKNLYAQQTAGANTGIVGIGELKQMTTDWPTRSVYGFGWFANTSQVGVLVPENQIFGIYGASADLPQNPSQANLFVYGQILSRNPGWTAPMSTSASGPGTISGNTISFGWTGSSLKTAVDTTERIIPTCSPNGSNCTETIEPIANLNNQPDFELRCTENGIMRGLKWTSATGELSLICTR